METELKEYLPTWFCQVFDFKELMRVESAEMKSLNAAIGQVKNNFYFQTMDNGTVEQYEKIFGILANKETETLDFRRARVLNRMSIQPPFTLKFLYEKLDQIIGKDQWEVSVDYESYTLYVEASAENQSWASELYATINTIKPCHMVYINRPRMGDTLWMEETMRYSEQWYQYRLGSWGLGVHPFMETVDKGVIVTPSQKSIQNQFTNDVAAFAASDITSVRVNGTIVISNFTTKKFEENVTTIEYTVSNIQTSAITKEELLNAEGKVLTSANVYIPVPETVQLKHIITITQGG